MSSECLKRLGLSHLAQSHIQGMPTFSHNIWLVENNLSETDKYTEQNGRSCKCENSL